MPAKRQSSDSTTKNKHRNHSLAAVWTVKDIKQLIDILHTTRRTHSTDDNSASYKPQTWHIVAEALKETHTKGGIKDARSCKDKWKTVSSAQQRVEVF
jgi:hypothetical protein